MKSLNVIFPAAKKVELIQEEIQKPGAAEVLCKAEKSLISTGTEAFCLEGNFDPGTNWKDWVQYPFNPGYSMAAEVIEVGKDVKNFKVGDRIAAVVSHRQYFTFPDKPYYPGLGEAIYKYPEQITPQEACWMTLAVTTQLGARRAKLKLGETVAIIGMGLLGQLVVQYLALNGARKVISIDTVTSRLELAAAHGATHTIQMDAKSARAEIEKLTDGKMLDVVYDITGHPSVLSAAVALVHPLGRVVLLGDTPNPNAQYIGPGVVSNSISILGIHGSMSPDYFSQYSPWTRDEMTGLFYEYLMQGRMNVKDLISGTVSPKQAPEIFAELLKDRSKHMGIIFDWNLL